MHQHAPDWYGAIEYGAIEHGANKTGRGFEGTKSEPELFGGNMIRSELLLALARENPELRAEDVERAVDIFFDEIADRLARGGRVELRGFGAFSTRQRDPRNGRNPRTGEAVSVPHKRVPYFKPGKEMRQRLNGS